MNHSADNTKNSDQRWPSPDSDCESWPKTLREPLEEVCGSGKQRHKKSRKFAHEDAKNHMKDKDTSSQETFIQIQDGNHLQDRVLEDRNPFWISVSGYEYASAHLVYKFFSDIGQIVGKYFTESNLMYLKYFSMLDCEIALSYNGQKIGYGGDISVKVKPENPVTRSAIIEALEECLDDEAKSTSTPVTIDGEKNRNQNATKSNPNQLKIGRVGGMETIPKRVSIMQWLKEKLSYMFYFY